MSAAPRFPPELGYAGLKMTADEFLSLAETPERYQLIDGVVVMSPSASAGHNEIAAEIIYQLKAYAGKSGAIRVFPETDVRFRADKVYCRDVSVYLTSRLPDRPERLDIAPDLVVEVLSPGTKALDLITKRDDYDAAGVREYWAVDPANGDVRVWQQRTGAGGQRLCEAPPEGETIASTALAGLVLDLRPLRAIAGK
jgi:Uma2 family endonuclease